MLVLLTRLKNSNIQPLLNVEFQTPKGRNTDLNKAVNKVNLKIGNIFTGLNFQCNKTWAARRSPRSGESDNRCTALVGGKWSLLCFIPPHPPLQRQMKLFSSHTTAKTNMEFKGYFLCVFLRDISFDSKRERKMFCQWPQFLLWKFLQHHLRWQSCSFVYWHIPLICVNLKNFTKTNCWFFAPVAVRTLSWLGSVKGTVWQTPLLSETCAVCSSLFHSCLHETLVTVPASAPGNQISTSLS